MLVWVGWVVYGFAVDAVCWDVGVRVGFWMLCLEICCCDSCWI